MSKIKYIVGMFFEYPKGKCQNINIVSDDMVDEKGELIFKLNGGIVAMFKKENIKGFYLKDIYR